MSRHVKSPGLIYLIILMAKAVIHKIFQADREFLPVNQVPDTVQPSKSECMSKLARMQAKKTTFSPLHSTKMKKSSTFWSLSIADKGH